MPRPRRTFSPGLSAHVIQRGNNRSAIFAGRPDYEVFLDLLRTAAGRHAVAVHAYALMTNHYHLLVTPDTTNGLPLMMKALNGNYVRYYNRHHQRIGTLWNGRYRGIPIGDERYWLTCLTYIEQNPARAGMTSDLAAYPWSSYRFHASDQAESSWVAPHPVYLALGRCENERRAAYRTISADLMDPTQAFPFL